MDDCDSGRSDARVGCDAVNAATPYWEASALTTTQAAKTLREDGIEEVADLMMILIMVGLAAKRAGMRICYCMVFDENNKKFCGYDFG